MVRLSSSRFAMLIRVAVAVACRSGTFVFAGLGAVVLALSGYMFLGHIIAAMVADAENGVSGNNVMHPLLLAQQLHFNVRDMSENVFRLSVLALVSTAVVWLVLSLASAGVLIAASRRWLQTDDVRLRGAFVYLMLTARVSSQRSNVTRKVWLLAFVVVTAVIGALPILVYANYFGISYDVSIIRLVAAFACVSAVPVFFVVVGDWKTQFVCGRVAAAQGQLDGKGRCYGCAYLTSADAPRCSECGSWVTDLSDRLRDATMVPMFIKLATITIGFAGVILVGTAALGAANPQMLWPRIVLALSTGANANRGIAVVNVPLSSALSIGGSRLFVVAADGPDFTAHFISASGQTAQAASVLEQTPSAWFGLPAGARHIAVLRDLSAIGPRLDVEFVEMPLVNSQRCFAYLLVRSGSIYPDLDLWHATLAPIAETGPSSP